MTNKLTMCPLSGYVCVCGCVCTWVYVGVCVCKLYGIVFGCGLSIGIGRALRFLMTKKLSMCPLSGHVCMCVHTHACVHVCVCV